MAECAFQSCINHGSQGKNRILLGDIEGLSYHPFPKDPTLREKWVTQMNQEDWAPTSTSSLCSLHFNKEYFITDEEGQSQLKPDAIPTEFEFIFKREMDMTEPINMVCCAYKCGNTYADDPGLTFHTFPMDQPDLCAQWLTAMNCNQIDAEAAVLCSEHFDPSCFVINEEGEKMLVADAIPSLFIPPEEEEHENDTTMEDSELPMEEDTNDAAETPAFNDSSDGKCEITEEELDLIRRHDETVALLIEEGQRLVETTSRRKKLEKKRNDLCYILDACLRNGPLDKTRIKSLKPLIKEVEDTYQQILIRCLEPCIVNSDIHQE